jgi:signal transduction histidine kinase
MPTPEQSAAEAHQRLVAQYNEIAALAGGLAHEIKNPLSTIRLNLELLAEDFAEPQTPRERRALQKIAVVERECQRLGDLLDNFLNYTKVRPLRLEASNLNAEVERLMQFIGPQAAEASIEMLGYFDPDIPSVLLDRETFQSALLNLALNAIQAMPDGGQLVLRTRVTRGGAAFDLIDNGQGMDEETLAHIFEAFYSTKRGGTGLGLPTTRKIVEAHGGRLYVQSAPGRGTQFTIELPLPPRLPAAPAAETPAA